jgi:hypothetical protein
MHRIPRTQSEKHEEWQRQDPGNAIRALRGTIAGLANIASNYLVSGKEASPSRHGTAHPSIVPYQVFPCRDGFLMIGAGNNKQVRCSDTQNDKVLMRHLYSSHCLLIRFLASRNLRAICDFRPMLLESPTEILWLKSSPKPYVPPTALTG